MGEPIEPDVPLFQELMEAEERHFWFRSRNQIIAAAIHRITRDLPNGYRILEVGCGNGNVLRTLETTCPRGELVGADLFEQGLELARSRVRSHLVQADVYALPFQQPFDVVGMFDVLEHLPDDQGALLALRRVLTTNGRLVLTVPAHQALWSYADVAAGHQRRYSPAGLAAVLDRAGFQVEYMTPFMAAVLPVMWMGRRLTMLKQWLRRGEQRSEMQLALRELRVPRLANVVMSWLLRPEVGQVARGSRIPFGSSLLAIAVPKRMGELGIAA